MNTPADLLYAATHEWIRLEGDVATVGITDHAQAELTDIVYAEPPAVGREVTAGEACAVVESVKAASDIYAPVSGTVTAVNEALGSSPALINTDAFGEGWLFKVKLSAPGETAALQTPEAYAAQLGA